MRDRELLIGVTGGIAAFKTAALVSQLAKEGARVTVLMSAAAHKFVAPATFAALSGRPVVSDAFDPAFPLGAHIELAQRGELFCVAPATADFLSRAAAGAADDLLTATLLCFAGPVLLAPAMNSEMWAKPAVQRNVAQLRADGVHFVDPQEGWLSCRQVGAGRMAEPERIVLAMGQLLGERQ